MDLQPPVSALLMFLLFCHMEAPTAIAISGQNQTNISTDHHQVNCTRHDNSSGSTSTEDKISPFCPDGTFSRDGITCSTCATGCPESMYISTPCSPEMDTQCAFCPSSNATDRNLLPDCVKPQRTGDNKENEMLPSCETDFHIFAYFTVPVTVLNVILFGCFMLGWCRTCTDLCQSSKPNETIPSVSRVHDYLDHACGSFMTLFNRVTERSLTFPVEDRMPSAAVANSGACEETDERADNHADIPAVSDRQLSCDRFVQTVCESNVSVFMQHRTQPPSATSWSEPYKGESAHVTLNDGTPDTSGNIYQKTSPLNTPKSRSSGQRTWNVHQPMSRPHIILNDISPSSTKNEDRTKPKSKTSGCAIKEGIIRNEFDVSLSRRCEEAEDFSRQQRVLPILHKFDTSDVCCYYLSDSSGASSTRSSIIGDPRLNLKKDVDEQIIQY